MSSFEQLKKQWLQSTAVNQIQWNAHGNNYQRSFYILEGVQITVNNCFPFSGFRKSSQYFLLDCVMEDNAKIKNLLEQYNGKLNTWCLYTVEENVGVPQFNTDEDMLRFMSEVDYKSLEVKVSYC